MQNLEIPTLQTAAVSATFDAFKEDERFSFIRPYSPTVQAVEGYRHAVIRYRNTDNKTVSKTAQMVTVPQVVLSDEYLLPEKASKVLIGVLEDEQDNIIRALIDSGASRIMWDSVTLDATLDSLTAVRVSNRLTKEQIENWARIALKEACEVRAKQISEAKKYNEEQTAKQIAGTLNAYVDNMCKLAAPVPNLGEQTATALKNMLVVAKLSDDMAKVLLNKLEAILNPKVVESGDL